MASAGGSYRIIMELSDDQWDDRITHMAPLFHTLECLGVSGADMPLRDAKGKKIAVPIPPVGTRAPEVVPSFLTLKEHCTKNLFDLMDIPLPTVAPTDFTPGVVRDGTSTPSPLQQQDTSQRRLFFDAESSSPIKAASGGLAALGLHTPTTGVPSSSLASDAAGSAAAVRASTGGRGTSSSRTSTGSCSSTARSQPRKEWHNPSRFTIRCSEVQISYLCASMLHTPIAFTELMELTQKANADEERRREEARAQGPQK